MECRGEAYAALLTFHSTSVTKWKTKIAAQGAKFDTQINLLRTLLRSLRAVEHAECHRDFVLLLGVDVKLAEEHRSALQRDGFKTLRITPVQPGIPTTDKLHAWRLTNYTRVLFLDADVMAIASLDDAFRQPEEFVIAAHPYDTVQGAACGQPLERRGVTGMFALRPSISTFDRLIANLQLEPDLWDVTKTRHTPEQTGLSCFFRNVSRTWPCSYLFDIGNGGHTRGAKHFRGCQAFQGVHQPGICEAIADHIAQECTWARSFADARAVHFKGSLKPWKAVPRCAEQIRKGRLMFYQGANWVPLSPRDDLRWNQSSRTCTSVRHAAPVRWPDEAALPNRCCTFETLLKAEWHAFFLSAQSQTGLQVP
ncbi:hypothetical protein AB1Y20_000661 [Prymnesium parvum]|uniref:Hexosyltransferase n=1 Tax=Prymnesium parvum TaxID=97485 RepID=A0AB34K5H0_PRYPA